MSCTHKVYQWAMDPITNLILQMLIKEKDFVYFQVDRFKSRRSCWTILMLGWQIFWPCRLRFARMSGSPLAGIWRWCDKPVVRRKEVTRQCLSHMEGYQRLVSVHWLADSDQVWDNYHEHVSCTMIKTKTTRNIRLGSWCIPTQNSSLIFMIDSTNKITSYDMDRTSTSTSIVSPHESNHHMSTRLQKHYKSSYQFSDQCQCFPITQTTWPPPLW